MDVNDRAVGDFFEMDKTPAIFWDEDFVKVLEERSKTFIDGTAKTYTWDETKQAAIDRVASKKK